MTKPLVPGFAAAASLLWLTNALPAQTKTALKLDTGMEIFEAACKGCHGPDGKGQSQTTACAAKLSIIPAPRPRSKTNVRSATCRHMPMMRYEAKLAGGEGDAMGGASGVVLAHASATAR